ncbi:MAG: DUF302 domain-containing protein [bacterium]
MKVIRKTRKSVDEAVEALTESIIAHKFGVMHVHDLHGTLNKKGVPFDRQCNVLEVCNPVQAAKVLNDDMDMNMALPCRISVYEKDGETLIGMLSPSAMLLQFSDSPVLKEVAEDVEGILTAAIEDAI